MEIKYYTGMDIHKEDFTAVTLNQEDEVIAEGKFPNNIDAIKNFFTGLHPCEVLITIEAGCVWKDYYNKITKLGYKVFLANPVKAKERSNKKKTDRIDAKTLAELLRAGFLPKLYIPNEDVIRIRDLSRHRARMTRIRSQIKSKIKSYLLMDGVKYDKKIWNIQGIDWLKGLKDPNIQNFVNVYEILHKEIKEIEKRVRNVAKSMKSTNLLMSIPGVGYFNALHIVAEIGDINRFENPKALISYAGLCPGIHQSGPKSYTVPGIACNKWLKWSLYESSGKAARQMATKYSKHYYKLKNRKNFQIARRSTARKMLTDIFYILKNEVPYQTS